MPVAQDYYGYASLLGDHDQKVDRPRLFLPKQRASRKCLGARCCHGNSYPSLPACKSQIDLYLCPVSVKQIFHQRKLGQKICLVNQSSKSCWRSLRDGPRACNIVGQYFMKQKVLLMQGWKSYLYQKSSRKKLLAVNVTEQQEYGLHHSRH
ncbi:uncharacterized protein LOC144581686 [Callithrix jacchus]